MASESAITVSSVLDFMQSQGGSNQNAAAAHPVGVAPTLFSHVVETAVGSGTTAAGDGITSAAAFLAPLSLPPAPDLLVAPALSRPASSSTVSDVGYASGQGCSSPEAVDMEDTPSAASFKDSMITWLERSRSQMKHIAAAAQTTAAFGSMARTAPPSVSVLPLQRALSEVPPPSVGSEASAERIANSITTPPAGTHFHTRSTPHASSAPTASRRVTDPSRVIPSSAALPSAVSSTGIEELPNWVGEESKPARRLRRPRRFSSPPPRNPPAQAAIELVTAATQEEAQATSYVSHSSRQAVPPVSSSQTAIRAASAEPRPASVSDPTHDMPSTPSRMRSRFAEPSLRLEMSHLSPPLLSPLQLGGSPRDGAFRRSPSAHLPSPRRIRGAQTASPPDSAHGSGRAAAFARRHLMSSPLSGGSSLTSPGSSGSTSSGARTDSLEDAWRRKILLNMNLLPDQVSSSGGPRSPPSLAARRRSARNRPPNDVSTNATTNSRSQTRNYHPPPPPSPLIVQSNAVLDAMPVIERIQSDSFQRSASPPPPASQQPSPSPPISPRAHESTSSSPSSSWPRSRTPVDVSSQFCSLTGADLDACEADTQRHLREYYSPTASDSLDNTIRDMESRKAITLRIRGVGWAIAVAFALAFIGDVAMAVASDSMPVQGTLYAIASFLSGFFCPLLGRQTRWFNQRPLLPLQTLFRALNGWAVVTCLVLFVGGLQLKGPSPLPDSATLSDNHGWSLWILCSLPLFISYLLHDLHSRVALIWACITTVTLVLAHLINAIWLRVPAAGLVRGEKWYYELSAQILFLALNLFFARAASLSIQGHVVQLWHREKFMLEQGKLLAAQREAAFSTANTKSSFLATMSHELRTPLNGVIGLCSLVLESELTIDQRECLNTVIKSGETLLCVINDILLFSKLEAGELLIEQLPFSPMNAVEDVLDIFALSAAQHENELIAHFRPGLPLPAWGDVMRLRQVLTNLVSNAIKFSHRGGEVVVTVEPYTPSAAELAQAPSTPREGSSASSASPSARSGSGVSMITHGPRSDSDSSHVHSSSSAEDVTNGPPTCEEASSYLKFSVQDSGCGIPRSKQHRLFHAFSQVDASDTRKHGGTGLGLVICKRLVELMSGRMGFESAPGIGSTFYFYIKVHLAGSPQASPPANQADANKFEQGITKMLPIAIQEGASKAPSDSSIDQMIAAGQKPALQVDIAAARTPDQAQKLEILPCAGDLTASISASSSNGLLAPIGFQSQLSPSHQMTPSHFHRFSARLAGKRLLIVDRARSSQALAEMTRQWGMHVRTVNSRQEWEAEWADIVQQTQAQQQMQHDRSESAISPSGITRIGRRRSTHRSSFSYDSSMFNSIDPSIAKPPFDGGATAAAVTATSTGSTFNPHSPTAAKYDIILVLDSMLGDDTFSPYTAYNQAMLAIQPSPPLQQARLSSAAAAAAAAAYVAPASDQMSPLPPLHAPAPLRLEQLQLLGSELNSAMPSDAAPNASTCTTAHDTPRSGATPARMTPTLTGEDSAFNTAPSTPPRPLNLGANSPLLLTNLHESITGPTMAMRSEAPSEASAGGRSLFSPILPASLSSSPPVLPAFILLLSQAARHGRLAAASDASLRGMAGVVMKPTKWRNLLQAMLRAVKHKPSGVALHKAASVLGVGTPFQFPSPMMRPHRLTGGTNLHSPIHIGLSSVSEVTTSRSVGIGGSRESDSSLGGLSDLEETRSAEMTTTDDSHGVAASKRMTLLHSLATAPLISASPPQSAASIYLPPSSPSRRAASSAASNLPVITKLRSSSLADDTLSSLSSSSLLDSASSTPAGLSPVRQSSTRASPPIPVSSKTHSRRASSKKAPAGPSVPANASLRILVAEDNLINQKVVVRMLKHLGYNDVTIANDGVECLQLMARANQHHHAVRDADRDPSDSRLKPFDLLLLDKSMPRLGGITTARRIRARICSHLQPKIIAVTANVLPADQVACVEAGMQEFLAKPILLPQLRSMLDQCQSLSSTTTPSALARLVSPTVVATPESMQSYPSSSPLTGCDPAVAANPAAFPTTPAVGVEIGDATGTCVCSTLWQPHEATEEE